MRALVARDLADAGIAGLSADRRFATALGSGANKLADYFEACRRKRNVIDYTRSHVATDTEAKEIVGKATEFYELVEGWIDSKHPSLKR